MFINCPNRCSDARLQEVQENAIIITSVEDVVVEDGNIFLHLDEDETIETNADDLYYRCSVCHYDFGNLHESAILELMGKK